MQPLKHPNSFSLSSDVIITVYVIKARSLACPRLLLLALLHYPYLSHPCPALQQISLEVSSFQLLYRHDG